MNIRWTSIASGVMLLLAIPTGLPYGYYELLRIVVFASAIFVAWKFYQSKLPAWTLIFSAIAFLFNPIAPIYLTKSAWVSIDLISAILFFLAAYAERRKK